MPLPPTTPTLTPQKISQISHHQPYAIITIVANPQIAPPISHHSYYNSVVCSDTTIT